MTSRPESPTPHHLWGVESPRPGPGPMADALAASEARLRQLVAFSTDVILDIAPDNTQRWISPAVTDLLGWQPAELVGTSADDLIHPDDVAAVRRVREQAEGGQTDVHRFRMRTREGDYRWVSGRSNEIRVEGRHTGRVVTIRDAESQVRAESELRASQERYRLLAENSSDVVFEGDASGVFTWITDGVTVLLGWRPHEVVGMPFREFVHSEDVAALDSAQRRLVHGEPQTLDLRVQTVAGDYRWVSAAVRPLLGSEGDLAGVVGSWRDVNTQRLAAEALARSEDLFRTAMDNSANGMCLVGPDGTFLRVNAAMCAILGRPAAELMAGTWQKFTHPEDLAADQGLAAKMLSGEQDSYRFRKRYLRPDGEVVWCDLAVACVRNADGTVRNFITQVTDITESQHLQDAYKAILDSLLDPHVLLEAVRDADGVIVDFRYADVNQAASDYMRMTPEELTGSTVLQWLPGQVASGMLTMYAEAVETGTPLVLDDFPYRHEIQGSERRYDVRGVKIGDALSFTWRDVTDRPRDTG